MSGMPFDDIEIEEAFEGGYTLCEHAKNCAYSVTAGLEHAGKYCCSGGVGCIAYMVPYLRGASTNEFVLVQFQVEGKSARLVSSGGNLTFALSKAEAGLLVFGEDTHVPLERSELNTDKSSDLD